MELGNILQYAGFACLIVGYIWGIVLVFRRNVLVGVLSLCGGIVVVCYLMIHFDKQTWKPLLLLFMGMVGCLGGSALLK